MGQCYSVRRYKVKDTTKRPKYCTNIHSAEGLKADLVEPSHKEHIEETITENNGEDVKPVDNNEQVQQQQAEVEIKDSELLKTRKLPEALKEEQEKSLQEEQDSEGTTMMSTSVRFRQEGNKVYITAKSNIPAKVQLERLQSASNLYYKAYNASANMDEKASSAKNLGMASWRIGQLMEELNEKNTVIFHFYKEAFKYLSEAWMKSCDVKPVNWRDGLSSSAFTVWEEYKQSRLSEIRVDKRVKILYDILQTIEIPAVRAECYVHIGTCHFHAGVTAIQTKNFKTALYEMKECYLPVTEAAALGKSLSLENVKKETETLESDVTMHLCLAESMQANTIGEDLFKKLLMDEENLNMDMVYEIIDWHRQAVLRTREITEVEVEAIALSRIGKVYDKVLKLKAKAKEYLMRSMQLANSMHPRTFHGEEWFEDCKEILAKYQKEVVEQESEVWQKERASLLKELEKELKDLKTNDEQNTNSRSEGFLKFVYKEYPPTNTANKLEGVAEEGPMAAADLKKILQKAIVHYHPDRVDVEKFGKKRKVLSEEITKCLTRRYESFKIG